MATTPTPQDSSNDPQVPGNYPGTVQNPTQSPAPVNPATDPEVPPLPNDVDPNFITNPDPVNNTIDPEVPQPVDNTQILAKLSKVLESPEDSPPAVSPAANPEVPQPVDETNLFVDSAPPQNFFVDPQVPEPPIVQNFFTDATPAPVTPVVNSQVPQPTTIVETYFSSATPVQPVTNSQVPQPPVQNIFTLIASLFSRTPTTVAPAVNPQVAEAIPVPTPAAIEPTAIPPVSNPQVAQAIPVPTPTVSVPTAIPPVSNPQVPEPPIVQNYFVDEPPVVQNYFTDAVPSQPTPIPISAAERAVLADTNPQVPQPTPPAPTAESIVNQQNPNLAEERFSLKIQIERELQPQIARELQEQNPTWSPSRVFATSQLRAGAQADAAVDLRLDQQITAASQNPPTVSPAANPEVPQPPASEPIPISAAERAVLADTNPQVPQPTPAFSNLTINGARVTQADARLIDNARREQNNALEELLEARRTNNPERIAAAEAANSQANRNVINVTQEVEQRALSGAGTPATVSPAANPEVPQPAAEPLGGKTLDPEPVSPDVNPEVPGNYPGTFQNPTQLPASVDPAVDPEVSPLPNDVDPNFIPNTAPVNSDIDPQVPSSANVRVENINQAQLAEKDPALYQQWQATFTARAERDAANETKLVEAELGRPVTAEEKASIDSAAAFRARTDTNAIYKDELQAANVATVVPADTPPPTVAAPPVNSAENQQVPPAQTGEALVDPDTGEVLGYVDTATGEITDTPPAVSSTANPQVPSSANTIVTGVNQTQLSQSDSALSAEYNSAVATNTEATEVQLTKQALATYGVSNASDLPIDVQIDIREQALTQGVTQANAEFKDQLEASGAATSQPTGTPPPTVDAAPPSPSPYERFLAQEAAATDAAQVEATARFNSQFDVVSDDDPQAFPVDDGAAIQGTELEPIDNNNAGYSEFYGNDTGEFQDLALEPTPTDFTDYDEFYGDDTGEFQDLALEPGVGDGESAGYDEFYGDDTGEFQDLALEPGVGDGESAGFGDFGGGDALGDFIGSLKSSPSPVSNADASASIIDGLSGAAESAIVNLKTVLSAKQIAANREKAARDLARQQNIINQQRKQANSGDWRVRLRLAPNADYLYKARGNNGSSAAGILQPLAVTDGVIFPYTPQINTSYQAKYNPYELTHSNYKGYFYQGSSVGEISINATFTAQDTQEANYLLAVIHFFRSVTKMFYGQDDAAKRGAPPPLVFLQGLGEYQFNLHPCVVSNFNYILPADVDYIRALSPNNDGTNLSDRRSLQSGVTPFINPSASRLQNAGLPTGGIFSPPPPPTLGTNSPTYVPTKMDIQLTLLAVQTRSQVSNQFSLKNFANGNLIKGGFW